METIERVRGAVQKVGFKEEETSFRGIKLYHRQNSANISIIAFLEEPLSLGMDDLGHIAFINQVREQVTRQDNKEVAYLSIILTRNPQLYKNWSFSYNSWIISLEERRLFIYENQPSDFYGIRQAIEEALDNTFPVITKAFPFMTTILLSVNVILFLCMQIVGWEETFLAYGAMYWPAMIKNQEWYRFITAMFLHFSSSHLVNNMLILFVIGSRLEDIIGHTRFLILYFISGILAGIVSMGYNMMQNRIVIAAGASGAIFGLVGAFVWVILKNKGRVKDLSMRQIILFAGLSLYGGLVNQQTDNAAHLGGLLAGFFAALFLYHKTRKE